MVADARFLSFYLLLAWAMAVVMFAIFVVSVLTGFLPTGYAFLSLGASIVSGYLGIQIRRLGRYREQLLERADREVPSERRPAYPPLSRVLVESGVVAAITVGTAFEAGSVGVVLLVYLVGMAAIAVIEGTLVARRRLQ